MAATVQDVADRARYVLNDPSKVRWTDAELFKWVTDALMVILTALPDLFRTKVTHTATSGALQTITTARAKAFRSVVGATMFSKTAMDSYTPAWQTGSTGTVEQYSPAENPLQFYVYPPSAVSQSIPIEIIQAPVAISALSDAIPIPDDYVSVLADYVIGMSEAKDAAHVNSGRAQAFMQAFASKLGMKGA